MTKNSIKRTLLATTFVIASAASAMAGDNSYCREFTKNIIIDGKKQNAYGTACLQEDGSWKIASKEEPRASNDNKVVKKVIYTTSYYNRYRAPVRITFGESYNRKYDHRKRSARRHHRRNNYKVVYRLNRHY